MIDGMSLPVGTEIYTYVSPTGEQIDVHTKRLTKYCRNKRVEIVSTPVRPSLAREFVKQNAVSLTYVVELGVSLIKCKKNTFERMPPIYLCEQGTYTNGRPDVYLVDGHHRYVMAAAQGWPLIRAYYLKYEEWQQFRIFNLPDITRAQLIEMDPERIRKYLNKGMEG